MEFLGTKGQWEVRHYNQVVCMYSTIADCENFTLDNTGKEAEANALLISKAPEMLEILIYLVNNEEIYYEAKDKVLNLIKEATEL